jgi:hypothetical protein
MKPISDGQKRALVLAFVLGPMHVNSNAWAGMVERGFIAYRIPETRDENGRLTVGPRDPYLTPLGEAEARKLVLPAANRPF